MGTVGYVNLKGTQDTGRDARRKQDLKTVRTALVSYYQDFGVYPPSCNPSPCTSSASFTSDTGDNWIPGLTPTYIQKLPKDPKQTSLPLFLALKNFLGQIFEKAISPPEALAAAPTVITNPAFNITSTSAVLYGSANPNGLSTTGWFRYSSTNPGSCNDNFGARTPSSGGLDLGSGTTSVAYVQSISGLSPGLTYYFCAIASNSSGIGFGIIRSFTTLAASPTPTPTPTPSPSPTPSVAPTPTPTPTPAPTPTPTPAPSPTAAPSPSPTPPPVTGCASKQNVYCYIVDANRTYFILWAQLDKSTDPERVNGPSSTCNATPPTGTTFNYCLEPPQ